MDGKEEVKRGDLEKHYEDNTVKDVELNGEMYDITYKMPLFGEWMEIAKEKDQAKQNMKLARAMEPKLNGVTVDWDRLRNPKLSVAILTFCVNQLGDSPSKN